MPWFLLLFNRRSRICTNSHESSRIRRKAIGPQCHKEHGEQNTEKFDCSLCVLCVSVANPISLVTIRVYSFRFVILHFSIIRSFFLLRLPRGRFVIARDGADGSWLSDIAWDGLNDFYMSIRGADELVKNLSVLGNQLHRHRVIGEVDRRKTEAGLGEWASMIDTHGAEVRPATADEDVARQVVGQ